MRLRCSIMFIINFKKNRSMKYFLVLILFSPLSMIAQVPINVVDTVGSFSKATANSYRVQIPEAKLKSIDKNWTSYLKSLSTGKVQNINGEYWATWVVYKNISTNPINIYSKLLENNQGVQLTAWFTANDSVYFSKTENIDQNTASEKFVRDFAITEYKRIVQGQLDAGKEVQQKLEDKLAKAIKGEEKKIKKISEDNRSIDRNLNAIKLNEREQATQSNLIASQKSLVEKETGEDAERLKTEQQRLTAYEKDMKKLVKTNEKLQSAIDKWHKNIRDSKRAMEQSRKDQEGLNAQIEGQKSTVQKIQDKLNNIK